MLIFTSNTASSSASFILLTLFLVPNCFFHFRLVFVIIANRDKSLVVNSIIGRTTVFVFSAFVSSLSGVTKSKNNILTCKREIPLTITLKQSYMKKKIYIYK